VLPEFRFRFVNQHGDKLQCRSVISNWSEYASAQEFFAAVVERNDLYLGAAEVDAESHDREK
jgi:hypothetical protein